MSVDLTGLNEDQKEVVLHKEGAAFVVASPGAGKTRCVTYRIAQLIDDGVDPSRIFACTFTKKAAEEMKKRVADMIGVEGEYVKISTLHSFCYGLLRNYYARFENGKKVSPINGGDAWYFFSDLIRKEKLKSKDVKNYLSTIGWLKLNCVSPKKFYEEYLKDAEKDLDSPFDVTNNKNLALHHAYKRYEMHLQKTNKIDFADMLYRTYLIFKNCKNEKFLKSIQKRVDYLIVDEAQDTNPLSYYIYNYLIENTKNLMFVNDPRQAIYSFQGADISILNQFKEDYSPRVIELKKNYRSTSNIVDTANRLIAHSTEVGELSQAESHKGEGDPINFTVVVDEIHEADKIADNVELESENGVNWKDMAVLYRVHSQATSIIDALEARKIPYKVWGGHTIFNRKEIKVIVNYMRTIVNHEDLSKNDMWIMANNPVRYIKKITFEKIEDLLDDGNYDCFYDALRCPEDAGVDFKQNSCVSRLTDDLRKAKKFYMNHKNPTTNTLISYIADDMGVKKWFESDDGQNQELSDDNQDDRELNLNALYTMGRKYQDPMEFLAFVKATMKKEKEDKGKKDTNENAVNLLTLHASKGLEWPTVFIAGMNTRVMPFYRALENDKEDEERRLAYVGVTRAEERLYITSIQGQYGRFKVFPSHFAFELGLTNERAPDNYID